MRILVTGGGGQLASALGDSGPGSGHDLRILSRAALDVTDGPAIRRVLTQERPDVVVNAAAYTAVDRAEAEEALATRVNGEAAGLLASACADVGARMVQVSTDFVFDGTAAGRSIRRPPPVRSPPTVDRSSPARRNVATAAGNPA